MSKNSKQKVKHLMFVKSTQAKPKNIIVRSVNHCAIYWPKLSATYVRTLVYHQIIVNQQLLCLLYLNSSLKFPRKYTLEKTAV